MSEETFDLVYKTDASGALPPIDALRGSTIALNASTITAIDQIRKLGSAAVASAKNLGVLGTAIDGLTGKRAALVDLVVPFEFLDTALASVRQSLAGAGRDLSNFAQKNKDVGRVTNAMAGLTSESEKARVNVSGVTRSVETLGAESVKLTDAKAQMTGFQRSAFGAKMNVEEAGKAVSNLVTTSAGLAGAGKGMGAFGSAVKSARSEVEKTTPSVGGLGSSMLALQARIAIFHALKEAVLDLGKAFTDARAKADAWGKGNLAMRDEYRELANLQGKAEPDDQVVGGALRFRMATGLSNQGANDVLRRFEGELPAAKDAGNITGDATSGVAGDYLREATRTGLRVGLSGSTTGLLAAKLAMAEKIPSAEVGAGRFQTVVDLLNRGSGDLTPLTQSLVNTAGGNVGKGLPFKNLPQLAAAIEVSSANATPSIAGTRVRQAVAGLNRLRLGQVEPGGEKPLDAESLGKMTDADRSKWVLEHHGEARLKSLRRSDAADAKRGVRTEDNASHVFMRDEAKKQAAKRPPVDLKLSADDFTGNVEKLGDYLDSQKDKEAALIGLGLKNQTERRSLIQFSDNRRRLRTETDAANKGVAPAEAKRLNDQFFAGDTAQNRIAEARNDASEFVRGRQNEKLQIARKAAEERLRTAHQIDTPGAQFEEAMADNPASRMGAALARKAVGQQPTARELPVGMGGVPTRQLKIDDEAMTTAQKEARKVGLDPAKLLGNLPDDAPFEERFNALADATQKKGGNPFGSGGGQTDALLQVLIRETQRGNALLEKAAAPPQPGFLPLRPQALRGGGGLGDALSDGLAQWGL